MSKLSIEELNEFLDDLFDKLKEEAKFYNYQGEFDTFLSRYQFEKNDNYKDNLYNDNAKVLILGVRNGGLKSKDINGIFKKAGLKDKYKIIEYDDMTNFDVSILENSTQYTDVFIGAAPHKMKGIGDTDNPVQKLLEGSEGLYPKIHKLMTGKQLKITKTNLMDAIADSVLLNSIRYIDNY
ncbi:hypothetical protein ACEUW8_06505 [Staphylococcus pseudintermedius]|uniref:hypothetical protein n=1 Tax=Staphylococcus pseudintermedius TaxID=283734 RepID=UPI000C709F85|nr:hypothetical protein [Staphylococcus pseudintermedius]MDT0934665.1 hypothetical protein [Staphylococcus pseudintermedius]PKW56102.1 hypothetical protein CYJ01_07110 [Staphylococcus pseudintermedius]WQJ34800.1 hypothetical protein P3U58_00155 [Staphylococcus pseudintermedius]WQL30703.1 hypothetical protein P3U23_00155 [Staphylococcus pseudintermedius]